MIVCNVAGSKSPHVVRTIIAIFSAQGIKMSETIKSQIQVICKHYRSAVYVVVAVSYFVGTIVGAVLF